MSLSLNKILLANVATNAAGSYLQGVTISAIGIGNTTLMNAGVSSAQFVPAGAYILPQTTNNVAIEVNAVTSAGANAWTTYIAANVGGTIISDGWKRKAPNSSQRCAPLPICPIINTAMSRKIPRPNSSVE